MNIVEQIYDSMTTLVQNQLGVDYKKMRKIFQPDLNDLRSAEKSFAVRHLAANTADGVQRYYTMDHGFEVMVSRVFVDRLDDIQIQEVINELYSKLDDIITEALIKKLGLPSIVMIVSDPSISEPEVLENRSVLMRLQMNVKYRNAVNF